MRDEWFIRGAVPMTKSEVRAITVEKLELHKGAVLYDIGAGTGSVSIEAASGMEDGTVYAVEKNPEAIGLLHKNREKFGAHRVRIVEGEAPEALKGLETPTHAFLGGTSGKLTGILDLLMEKNSQIRVVVNAVTVETVSAVLQWTRGRGIEADMVQVQISRAKAAGRVHMMMGQNPVWIMAFGGPGEEPGSRDKVPAAGHIPRLLLAASKSGSGKTMMTCGILAALQRRGLKCRSFKCGPDYIDPLFHRSVLGIEGGNLDTYFLPAGRVREEFVSLSEGADISVVEGVMGYYDGVGGDSIKASSYDVARAINAPTVLILDCRGASLSLAAEAKGFLEYRKDSGIRGVILNRISPVMAERLKPKFEELGIRVYGYLPECEAAAVASRHLGLMLPEELTAFKEQLEALAAEIEKTVDMEGLIALAGEAEELGKSQGAESLSDAAALSEPVRIGIARNEAFRFYYQENIALLKHLGASLVEFDPIRDQTLPEGVKGLILGGGYPELYAEALSANRSMREAIKKAVMEGMPMLAECGGFLYLHDELETKEGTVYPMAGVISGRAYPVGKLSRFGYIELASDGGTPLLPGQETIRGHEFHYWESTNCGRTLLAVKPGGGKSWECVHGKDGFLAGFPHLYYPSNPAFLKRWLNLCRKGQKS